MIPISILDFIKTGHFGPVKLGMTIDEVITILGEPEDRYETPDATFIDYGWWEIHFLSSNHNKAFLIQNDRLLYNALNHDEIIEFKNSHFEIKLDFLQAFKHIRLQKIVDILKLNKIEYIFNENEPRLIKLANGIQIEFIDFEPRIPQKDGFSWADKAGDDDIQITDPNQFILNGIYNFRY